MKTKSNWKVDRCYIEKVLKVTMSLIGERSEPPSGLNGTRCLYNNNNNNNNNTTVTIPYISKCFYVNFFKRNHRVQRSTS